ncbi:ATP-binding protein [Acidithrix sp. C25]|uniref:sensor histidine kinase n=1 Tax=Acidithrix sp. C25 TaxID=1671482 RepID=UPI00191BA1BC|nr:ATP-binding protein [Acidithrix sp. C25]CAG4924951.1 unnamed protein product [Acidithrix sp. C25]
MKDIGLVAVKEILRRRIEATQQSQADARNKKPKSTLKAKLLITVALLVAFGLGIADLATYTALQSFLYQKLDQQLQTTIGSTAQALFESFQGRPGNGSIPAMVPDGSWGEIASGGRIVFSVAFVQPGTLQGSPPKIQLSGSQAIKVNHPTTVTASNGSQIQYRALAITTSVGNVTVILAIPETGLHATLSRLAIVTTLVSLTLLVILIALGFYLIGIGLAPLDRMTETADQISKGDFSRRIEAESRDAEVEKLADALNYMLGTIQAEIEKREASEGRLKRFVADASHELRTPLTSIRGYAELIETGLISKPEDIYSAAERITTESVRMAGLVEDLLLLARLDQARALQKLDVNFSQIVAAVVADAHVVEPNRPLNASIAPDIHVIGDQPRLTQVVSNIMSNLRTHTTENTQAEITLGVTADEQGAPICQLSVRDWGPGLSKEQLDHVFERFYRADPSRTRSQGGAGLGLSLVQSITESHNGKVWITSGGIGKGITIGVELPIANQGPNTAQNNLGSIDSPLSGDPPVSFGSGS